MGIGLDGTALAGESVNAPMTIALHTEKTPAQLNSAARFATFKRNLFWVGSLAIFWAIIHVVDNELAMTLDRVMFGAVSAVFGMLAQAFAAVSNVLGNFS